MKIENCKLKIKHNVFILTFIIITVLIFSSFNFDNTALAKDCPDGGKPTTCPDGTEERPIVCAPGDVKIDICGNVTTESNACFCLYGPDIAENRGFGGTITDPRANIRIAINVAMGFLGVLVVGMIIYGGILWLTAAGRDDQITKGKHVLIWAAIGGIVISIAWTITSYILQIGQTVG